MKLTPKPDDRGVRLDQFLTRHLENITRSQIQLLNRSGAIHIDGRQEKAGYRIRGGESVEVDLKPLETVPLTPEQIALQIHYEDEDLVVVEKPAGLVVHPGSGVKSGTLVHALLHHFQQLSSVGGNERPGIVHRLDKWTSGLLIVARNNQAHAVLGNAFQDRKIEKSYIALVHGKFAQTAGTIETSIGRHPTLRTRMAALAQRGRTAYTEYRVVRQFSEFSLLEVRIKTGRTHQIRVHLSAIGHPVVGDDVYGERLNKMMSKKYAPLDRYFLHAAYLRFTHPSSGVALEFHSPLPSVLQNYLYGLR
jgi:23S rRNA pseudouridine1911/1915/1917 synthase